MWKLSFIWHNQNACHESQIALTSRFPFSHSSVITKSIHHSLYAYWTNFCFKSSEANQSCRIVQLKFALNSGFWSSFGFVFGVIIHSTISSFDGFFIEVDSSLLNPKARYFFLEALLFLFSIYHFQYSIPLVPFPVWLSLVWLLLLSFVLLLSIDPSLLWFVDQFVQFFQRPFDMLSLHAILMREQYIRKGTKPIKFKEWLWLYFWFFRSCLFVKNKRFNWQRPEYKFPIQLTQSLWFSQHIRRNPSCWVLCLTETRLNRWTSSWRNNAIPLFLFPCFLRWVARQRPNNMNFVEVILFRVLWFWLNKFNFSSSWYIRKVFEDSRFFRSRLKQAISL